MTARAAKWWCGTIVLIALLFLSFAGDLGWVDAADAKNYDKASSFGLMVFLVALVFGGNE